MTTATATQTAAATDTNPCADCGALVAIPCYRPAWVYRGLCTDCATNAAAATATAPATTTAAAPATAPATTTAAAPAPRRNARYANVRRCRGRYTNGRLCTGDAFDGALLCEKCSAADGPITDPAPPKPRVSKREKVSWKGNLY